MTRAALNPAQPQTRLSETTTRELASYQKRVWRVNWFARLTEIKPDTPQQSPVWAVIQDTPYKVLGTGSSPLRAWQRAALHVEDRGHGVNPAQGSC